MRAQHILEAIANDGQCIHSQTLIVDAYEYAIKTHVIVEGRKGPQMIIIEEYNKDTNESHYSEVIRRTQAVDKLHHMGCEFDHIKIGNGRP